MSERVIAIGDIHGCSTALKSLVDAINPSPTDTIVTLGDYVDRGPDSKGVIDFLIHLQSKCRTAYLLGNHEQMMMEVLSETQEPYSWLRHGGVDTLESYGFSGSLSVVPESHRLFLENLLTITRPTRTSSFMRTTLLISRWTLNLTNCSGG